MRDACAAIEASDEIPSLDALATRAGYSRFHFLRLFRDHTGLTPRAYAEGVRARKLGAALAEGTRVADAVAGAGFGSESRVYEKTGALLGMTPGAARRGGAGEVIRTASADCRVRPAAGRRHRQGRLLHRVCRTGRGPAGRPPPPLPARLASSPMMRRLAGTVRAVLDFLEEPKQALGLPLDLRGTAFQQLVWRTLTRIPAGETRSYAEVAAMVGNPRAVRAVARSCASQPGGTGGAVPPRGGQRRRPDRLSLGRAAQACAARAGASG